MFTPHVRLRVIFLWAFCVGIFLLPYTLSHADTASSTAIVSSSTSVTAGASEERVVERRGRFAPQTKIRIKNLLENIIRRGNATVVRFDQISARIETRIQKIKVRGGDASAAEAALAEANTARTAAADILRTLHDSDVDVVVDAPVPHDALRLLGTRIANVHASLTTAKEALARAARALTTTPVSALTTASTTTVATTTRTKK